MAVSKNSTRAARSSSEDIMIIESCHNFRSNQKIICRHSAYAKPVRMITMTSKIRAKGVIDIASAPREWMKPAQTANMVWGNDPCTKTRVASDVLFWCGYFANRDPVSTKKGPSVIQCYKCIPLNVATCQWRTLTRRGIEAKQDFRNLSGGIC